MPSPDAIAPKQWLFNMEQWFNASGITDNRVKFALLATTQKARSYAILQADVHAFPHLDPCEIARRHILRQPQTITHTHSTIADDRDRAETRPANDPTANDPTANDPTANDPTANEPTNSSGIHASLETAASTEVASMQPAVAPREESEFSQALQQLETMLLGKIRDITNDIAELQALYPSIRRRQPTPARAGRTVNTPPIRSDAVGAPATESSNGIIKRMDVRLAYAAHHAVYDQHKTARPETTNITPDRLPLNNTDNEYSRRYGKSKTKRLQPFHQ